MPYLFTYFTGEKKDGEQIYFSVSRDGLHFEDLNNGTPVLKSQIGEGGVRDPFLIRDNEYDKFYIVATDLRIEKGLGWEHSMYHGSHNLVIFESKDLIHWSNPWLLDIKIHNAGDAWAPEVVYDETVQKYLLYWASMVDGKHNIYSAFTKDFKHIEEPKIFIEKKQDVIDTTIVKDDDNKFYRLTKNEENSRIMMECSAQLMGDYKKVNSEFLDNAQGIEGPQLYRLPNGNWSLIVDQFKAGTGYVILTSNKLASGNFKKMSKVKYNFGKNKKRHGSIIQISDTEYVRIKNFYN